MNTQDMLAAIADSVQGTICDWMREVDIGEEDYRVRWLDDDTALLMRRGLYGGETEVLRFRVEVTCSVVEPGTNQPSGNWAPSQWQHIPAGWFIRDPHGGVWEVVATEHTPAGQVLTVRRGGQRGTWPPRDPFGAVEACMGTAASVMQGAVDALGSAFSVDVLQDGMEE